MYKLVASALLLLCSSAQASLLLTSPTSFGAIDYRIPDFGGAVIDIVGKNNNRVTSFIGEGNLAHVGLITDLNGYAETDIGKLSFSEQMLKILEGGISQIGIRLTMWDGDNDLLNDGTNSLELGFHANKNFLYLNDYYFGNFSDVETVSFNRFGLGQVETSNTSGFTTDYTGVGWFFSNDSALVDNIAEAIFASSELAMKFVISGAAPNHANFISFSDRDDRLTKQVKSFTSIKVPEPNTIVLLIILISLLMLNRWKSFAKSRNTLQA